ncbi:hypothetical protein D3C75_1109890 [compost metagenome]
MLGLTVDDISLNAIANLGWKDITLSAPVFPGDTLYARSEVIEVRESAKRPGQGIVTTRTEAFNQAGTVCMSFTRACLVPTRQNATELRAQRAERS